MDEKWVELKADSKALYWAELSGWWLKKKLAEMKVDKME